MCNVRLVGQGILSLAGKCGSDHAYKYTGNNLLSSELLLYGIYTAIVAQYSYRIAQMFGRGKFGDSPNLPSKSMMFTIKIANKQEFHSLKALIENLPKFSCTKHCTIW